MKNKFKNVKADWQYYAVAAFITAQVAIVVAGVASCVASHSE